MKYHPKSNKKFTTFNIGSDHVDIKPSYVVNLKEIFTVISEEGAIQLEVDIIGDFENIPEKYHEIFLNMMTSKYLNKVSFGDNPFSSCKPVKEPRWWEFWKKTKYNY